jgi:hypothetical protein
MFKKASSAAAASEEAKTYRLWYVESLSDARTKPGKGRVLAHLGSGGCNTVFFNILLRGLVWKRRKPRQLLAFQKLQRRAATCGDE